MTDVKKSYEKAVEFLTQQQMGILSTISEDNKPWGSAVNFVIDDDLNFYFLTRERTYKYKNIETNPEVAFTVADEEAQVTVQLQGTISKVPTKDVMDVVYKKLARNRPRGDFYWVPPVIKVREGDYMVLRITPSKLNYADYKQRINEVKDEFVEQII